MSSHVAEVSLGHMAAKKPVSDPIVAFQLRVPKSVHKMLQELADKSTEGNKSLWVRNIVREAYSALLDKRTVRR